jgi:hypothetical protein
MIEYRVKVYKERTEWYLNGKLHRLNNPAIVHTNGTKLWFSNGKKHRLDGPASVYNDGYKEWWINHHLYDKYEHNIIVLFSILEPQRIRLNPAEG